MTYPKKKFDLMIVNKEYRADDFFISIGYTREINDTELGYDEPKIPASPNFLRTKFDDVIVDFGAENRAFTQENAEEILKFCKHALPTSTIHIHCQAGQSRSAGVGEALNYIYKEMGIESDITHESGYVVPNKTVIRLLLENKNLLTK